ncbi:MAG TPA: hypothetical protein VII82_07155, partial [Polyangiaceae bacterium]
MQPTEDRHAFIATDTRSSTINGRSSTIDTHPSFHERPGSDARTRFSFLRRNGVLPAAMGAV